MVRTNKPEPFYKVSSPLRVPVTKKRDMILNMNQVNAAHFRTYAKAKREYTALMRHFIKDLPVFKAVDITFILNPKTRRLTDLDNVCSIHAKFFQDALVHWGKLVDDDYKHVKRLHFKFGVVSPKDPRVDVIIKPIGGLAG